MTESTKLPAPSAFPLLTTLIALLVAHRVAFGQERPAQRLSGVVFGWLLAMERHTITRVLAARGLVKSDWSAFYRLLGTPRFDYDALPRQLLRATLPLAEASQPYPIALDGVLLPRHSRTMPGTGWALAPQTAVFRRGLQRAQRFVHRCWLPAPNADGYSRAVPVRWEPACPPKAVPAAGVTPRTEWAAGMAGLTWLRTELDAADRADQRLLAIGDGSYAGNALWQGVPARVDLLARCAKNRALFARPPVPVPGQTGRERVSGEQAPHPADWLAVRTGWSRTAATVRGREIPLTYRGEGPYLLKGAASHPLFLLVVKGVAKQSPRHKRRDPAHWLVSARADEAGAGSCRIPRASCWAGPGNAGRSKSPTGNGIPASVWANPNAGGRARR